MTERDEEPREGAAGAHPASPPERDLPEREPPTRDGWAAHSERQRRSWQATTPRQRLEWLEQAKRFAHRAREAAKRPER